MKIKLISLTLALFCLFGVLVACDSGSSNKLDETQDNISNETVADPSPSGSDKETSTKSEISTETATEAVTEAPTTHPTIAKTNYNDDFFLHVFERPQLLWVEESENDVFTEALFTRQQKIYDYLGVEMTAVQTGNLNVYGNDFKNAVKSKDGSVDVLVCSAYVSIASFILEGYLSDYSKFDQIDLSADYWKTDYMEEVMLGDDVYLGYSDFNIFCTHVISYNKDMLDQYSDALDESIYDTVRNYRWTLDKMISLANLVYIDKTSDGKTEDDTFGITGRQWIPFIGFLHACDIPLVEQDEAGAYKVSVYNSIYQEKTATLVNKLYELSKSNSAWFRYKIEETTDIPLTSGRSLMTIVGTPSIVDYLNYDINFGILPYPMFDENQKDVGYRSYNYDGFITFPSYMRNEDMSVETIEMLSFFSAPVQTAYYEKQLGKQVADAPDDSEMLLIVWDGICTDFGSALSQIDASLGTNLYMLPTLTHANTTENVASYVKSYENIANKALTKWMKSYEAKWGKNN